MWLEKKENIIFLFLSNNYFIIRAYYLVPTVVNLKYSYYLLDYFNIIIILLVFSILWCTIKLDILLKY